LILQFVKNADGSFIITSLHTHSFYLNYDFISDCYNVSMEMTYIGITIALNEVV